MSFEETLETLIRKVVREELQSVTSGEQLMTAEQVAEHLGYTDTNSVYRLKREKKLRAIVLGHNSVRFRRADVNKFVQERAQ